jgi:uncharacterized lipoprotein YmbA
MKKLCFLILIFVVSACSSPKPHFYQPVAIKTADVSYNNFKETLLVQSISLPAEAARPQITTLGKDDFELKIDEFNRWGASPEKLIQRVIWQNLNLYLPKASIEVQTPIKKNYKYAVAVEITEMGGKLGKEATLSASYFIKNQNGTVVKAGKLSESVAISAGYDAYVLAQSRLIGALSAQIAADVAHL